MFSHCFYTMYQPKSIFFNSLIFFLINSGLVTSDLPEIPPNPCPNIFQYTRMPSNGEVYGQITIPNDFSMTLNLGVNVSMKGYFNDNRKVSLKIELKTPSQEIVNRRAHTLLYNVIFPFQNAIPRITNIDYNNKVFCSGPPEELYPGGPGITSLWAGHKYFFQPSGQPPQTGNVHMQPTQRYPEVNNYPEVFNNPITIKKPEPVSDPTTNDPSSPKPVNFDTIFTSKPSNNDGNTIVNIGNTKPFSNPQPASNSESVSNSNGMYKCGSPRPPVVSLILGGEEVSDGMFPWLAAMFIAQGIGYEYKCTANLVSNRHVITAASCTHFYKAQIVKTEDILFVFGKNDIAKWATNGAVTRGAKKVDAHPEFKQNTAHADVAVITLDRPLEYSVHILPICLWEGKVEINEILNKSGTIAGWGTDEGAQKSGKFTIPVAKFVNMPVVDEESCLYSNLTYYALTSEMTFCAGTRQGVGPCIGDTGAGFMMNQNGRYYLRGLASRVLSDGKGRCDLANYVVFCDVAKSMDWVKNAMKGK